MKKTLLLLTGILALSATTMAAETTVAAPTATVVEKFQPTGFWNSSLNLGTNTTYNKTAKTGDNKGQKTVNNGKMQFENEAGVNLTPKLAVYIDNTLDMAYPHKAEQKGTDTVVRLNYNNGQLGSSDINFAQRLQFERSSSDTFRYRTIFTFAKLINADSAELDLDFDHTRGTQANRFGYDLDTNWNLGTDTGFSFEAELSGTGFKKINNGADKGQKSYSHTLSLGLNYDVNVYKTEANSLDLHAELYNATKYSKTNPKKGDSTTAKTNKLTSEVYANFSHKVNTATSVYLEAGIDNGYGLYTDAKKEETKDDFKRVSTNAYLEAGFNVKF